mmetsp:Transcript_992/g.3155  ORF Transcript_992/g.3155 Transcript_992/m.3155 type:complete len:383 (-) Transcript_992:474-1622(-)
MTLPPWRELRARLIASHRNNIARRAERAPHGALALLAPRGAPSRQSGAQTARAPSHTAFAPARAIATGRCCTNPSSTICMPTLARIESVSNQTMARCHLRGRTAPESMPAADICFSWRAIALLYLSLRSIVVAASHDHRSASARAAIPMRSRSSRSSTSVRTFSVKSAMPSSPGAASSPVCPSSTKSGTPPARTPTGGTPEAIDSSTTKPSVSESDGITNTSADANAADSSPPFIMPVKTTRPAATRSENSASKRGSDGPPPTIASTACGMCSSVCRSCCSRFVSHTRPTYTSSGRSAPLCGSMPPRRRRISTDLNFGSNLIVSTPFGHTSTFLTPFCRSSSASCGDVVSVRSARLWYQRMKAHAACSSQPNQLKARRYSRP